MTRLALISRSFSLVVLSGCATHMPPPQPECRLLPINGEQQAGMESPEGGCYQPALRPSANRTVNACLRP